MTILQFVPRIGRTAEETAFSAEMAEFMRGYEDRINELKEYFGTWDACDPVANAILTLVEEQNELAAAIDHDDDAALAAARLSRELAVAKLQTAVEEARREGVCPYCSAADEL
jgi:hypothetical protein